jgi:hypothetical protein
MTRLALVLLCALACGLAACGGDDDDGSAPSKQEFADRANEICRDASKALDDVGENAESPEEIADAVDRVIAKSREAMDDLSNLERPEGDAGKTAEEFVNATRSEIQDKGIPALEDLRDAIKSGDQAAAQEAAQKLQGISTEGSRKAATELGATECAND